MLKKWLPTLLLTLIVVLLASCGEETAGLTGTMWQLQTIHGEEVLAETEITAQFEERDGQMIMAGSGGCNDYTSTYTQDGDSLMLEPPIRTEIACMEPEGIMAQEDTYLDLLLEIRRYEIVDDELVMYDEGGNPILVYERI